MNRTMALLSAWAAFFGVALGALGAHGLKALARDLPDAAERLAWWETGARYHLVHALALGLTAVVAHHAPSRGPRVAAGLFVAGIAVFSGSLYAMGLTGLRSLGALTPLGGFAQLGGWLALAWSMRQLSPPSPAPKPAPGEGGSR
ncbi:MAG: DUF423 domain-containing protein [Myxococcaceae bacterium]|jgi:uncharacterized membrane protein YgdD (TMEM256/DUF423 family)|nr:DUF423 domain-containing protein [Myxococcaceae bacterium]MCA3012033.1 DUF423 domain-containing protein [Myxococcaceae bacterium]